MSNDTDINKKFIDHLGNGLRGSCRNFSIFSWLTEDNIRKSPKAINKVMAR